MFVDRLFRFLKRIYRFILPGTEGKVIFSLVFLALVLQSQNANAQDYEWQKNKTVIGTIHKYKVKPGESLIEIARKFGLGYNEITAANPGVDPFVPGKDLSITVPDSWILPDVNISNGIVINLSELRLYYFFCRKGSRSVSTFPIGIGSEGHDTPAGEFRVVEKIVNPSWHVPASIRKEKPFLPLVVPAGPDNPLGSHALRLSSGTILIHGTNRPWGVGRKASHGCLRLYPEDIPVLFNKTPKGSRVIIVRQQVKIGTSGNKVYAEIHNDDMTDNSRILNEAIKMIIADGLSARVSMYKLRLAVERNMGMPTDISS